jgi:L-asparaginase
MENMPHIQVFALGGTIAMVPGAEPGAIPSLDADALVSAVPQLSEIAEISAETLANVGSANISFELVADLCRRAEESDADGIVVTQGTDSLEETSFLASLLYQGTKPLIFTGAMRTPNQLSADGPLNLFNATLTASALEGGVYVVMNGDIHDPWYVSKDHTTDVSAFASGEVGIVGYVLEGAVHLREHAQQAPLYVPAGALPRPVALMQATLGDDTRLLDQIVDAGYEGLVLEAFGGGHLSEAWTDAVHKIAQKIPVVLCSRSRNGAVLQRTYGYKGAEMDLIKRGLMPSGQLKSRKVRLLLSVLLADESQDWQARFLAIKASF